MEMSYAGGSYGGGPGGGGPSRGGGSNRENPSPRGASNGVLEGVQTALDVAGLVPEVGEIADGINAIIYAANGDYVNASLSLAAMVPLGGQLGMKAADVAKTGNVIKKTSSKVDYLFKNRSDAMNWGRNQLGHNTQRMYDSSGIWIGWNGSNIYREKDFDIKYSFLI